MTFFQKLKTLKYSIQAWLFPKRRIDILTHYAAMPMFGTPNLAEETAPFRKLKKGISSKEGELNFKKEAAKSTIRFAKFPLVSCLMVTKNRFHLAQKSVESFVQQTYQNKELVIIDDGADNQLRDWITTLKHNKIRFFKLSDESQKLGVLRNLSRKHAQGAYLAQWDDDDVSHKNRLHYQMLLILKYNLDACSLQRETLSFPNQNRLGWSSRRLWEGSMIALASKLPKYQKTRRGEETDAVNQIALNGHIALLDFPQLYTYCFHGNNTFDEPHFEEIWKVATKVF